MKRITALLLAVAMLLSVFAGCAGEETEPTETTRTETQPTTQAQTEPVQELAAQLQITEVMNDNRQLVLGHELDWVEIYNPGDVAAELTGFYLTDDPAVPRAMDLAGFVVPAEGYLVVTLGEDSTFQLSEMGETVYLFRGNDEESTLTFGKAEKGESFDVNGACDYPTPGYANTEDGYRNYLEALELPELVISEAVLNDTVYPVDGVCYDLVEICNRSESPVDLSQYYLADRYENTKRFCFPDVILEPGEYYIVYCSGDPSLGENHAEFTLSAGKTLYLARKGSFVDALALPEDLQSDESFGRWGNLPVYLTAATPGGANTEGFLGGVDAPSANVPSGVYEAPVSLELSGTGTIYYTTDGTRPTEASAVYSGPVTIEGVTTVRAICVTEERISAISNFTYAVGVSHDLPILVISMPVSSRKSLIKNWESSQEYEAVLTLIEDGEEKFSVPFGIRLHGNDSRKFEKKNFQLRFRGEYGAGKLNYRLFENRDIDEFDSLLLKGGSEDCINAMIRDELASAVAEGTSELYTLAIKPVVLYLAGEYWGVHYLRERFSDEYVASHLGVSPESVDLLFSTSGSIQNGSNRDFNALKSYIENHNMTTTESYVYLSERIDVTSLIDWYCFRTYLDDRDLANIRRFRSTEYDGKWRWMFFDMDWGFYQQSANPVTDILDDYNGEPIVIQGLLASQAGRDAFLTRYAYLMRTALNEEHIIGCLDDLLDQIGSEMERDRARWNRDYDVWEVHINYIRKFASDDTRVELVLKDIQGYFGLTGAQMEYYFGDLWTDLS